MYGSIDGKLLTKTSTDIFVDIEAIGRYVNATNDAADTLNIKSDCLHIVAVKLKVAEAAAPLPTIPSKLTHTEESSLDLVQSS